jgi:hypothetical protein
MVMQIEDMVMIEDTLMIEVHVAVHRHHRKIDHHPHPEVIINHPRKCRINVLAEW